MWHQLSFFLCVLAEASVYRLSTDLTTAANDLFTADSFELAEHPMTSLGVYVDGTLSVPCLSACVYLELIYFINLENATIVTCCLFTSLELPQTTSWALTLTQGGGKKRGLEAMLFLIGPLIECHSGKPQGAGWIKLSRTQVRLR